ncbi:hypothetical protein RN001_003439 [Aquatica leii]|uniref:DUF4806 domain-containing protein n=1 Tax=Aquatica leii TaxID=1421715 RepID=A0AAN7PIK7_9COLE|nr:hypothetical protein RN001_003439 [Aquatica leii]
MVNIKNFNIYQMFLINILQYNLLQNVYEKRVKRKILLESYTDRLIKIEERLNIAPVHHEVTPLSMELPLKTIEDIKMFEISLLDDAQSNALVLKRTLGSNKRTTLCKMFAKLFDYNLATLCSWKGRKHNFRVENLRVIKIMFDAILKSFPNMKNQVMDLAEIDWLRSAQRLNRKKIMELTKVKI